MKQFLTLCVSYCLFSAALQAQDATPLIKRYLLDNQQKLHLTKEEASAGWTISDQYLSRHNQVTQVYLQQTINGLKLYNAISSVAVKEGEVVVFNSRFTPNSAQLANAAPGTQQISARKAILQAAANVDIPLSNLAGREELSTTDEVLVFTAAGSVKEPIKASLLYQKTEEGIRLAWNVEIQFKSDWWNIRVDAMTGMVLDKGNYTVYCNFDKEAHEPRGFTETPTPVLDNASELPANSTSAYRVFPFPGESPYHAAHVIITDPAYLPASPYGWHDTNGQPGAEYTYTRGNNVYASEDRDDDNVPGYSPDGGPNLQFDFPYSPLQQPLAWENAAITNLFYANNFLHDMTYHFGFDEAAGNFQENNYGNGGIGSDGVNADAQDGSGTNNANFSTPPDGQNGRMQMYIWTGGGVGSDSISINFPASIAGMYKSPAASFGDVVADTITANVVLVQDDTAPFDDGCQTILNSAQLNGKIVLMSRVGCAYTSKIKAAQDAGAVGVIVMQNSGAPPFSMPGADASATIPSVMITKAHGQLILDQLALGTVNVSLLPTSGKSDRDSDVDNGIIAHEFGHGISIRMTGGPSNSGCLNNAEQMGEGWGDYYALITTIHPTDTRFTRRPVGTYALNQPNNGIGIRNKIYSTDMSVNNYTYGSMESTGGEVHNIGELWTTMLWDLTWDLIDEYGFNPNLMSSTGGNNISQQLVTDGYKLQHCNPGFVDGRDAILQADELNYNGANKCLIWATFARRGLGYSAKQGSSDSYTDGIEAFDLPPLCQTAVLAPIAAFTVDHNSRCLELANFQFTDQSQNLAQYWLWDFGDGTTSTLQSPSHTYTAEGVYTIKLTVTNNIGENVVVKTNYISVSEIAPITVSGAAICEGQSAPLTATPGIAGNTAEWSDQSGNILYTGTTFNTPILSTTTTFNVNEAEMAAVQKIGPAGFGTGANHSSAFGGQIRFTAEKAFTIISVLVRAQGAGNRDISLFDSFGGILTTLSVYIPDGDSRVTLNLKIPGPGSYSLGSGTNANLYRTNAGISYPFTLQNLVAITGTSGGNQSRYYYFYDWEIQETPCRSAATPVTVTVTPGPVANFTSMRNGLNVTFTNLSTGSPSFVSWDFGDGSTATTPNPPTHTYEMVGIYTVVLTVSDGNCVTVFSQVINFTSGLADLDQNQFSVALSPNPASESVDVTLQGTPGGQFVNIGLYSVDGRLLQSQPYQWTNGVVARLDLKAVAAGMYLLKVEAEAGTVIKKLVVQ